MIIQFLAPFSSMPLQRKYCSFYLQYYLPVRANDESFIRFFVSLDMIFRQIIVIVIDCLHFQIFFSTFLKESEWSLAMMIIGYRGKKKSVGCENLYISSNGKGIIFSFIYIIKPSSALEDVLDVARLVCLFFRARTDKTAHERVFVGEDVPRDILTFIVSFSCHIYIPFLMPNHFLCYSSKGNIAYEFII